VEPARANRAGVDHIEQAVLPVRGLRPARDRGQLAQRECAVGRNVPAAVEQGETPPPPTPVHAPDTPIKARHAKVDRLENDVATVVNRVDS
jgi:hypothetical protein